MRKGFCVWMTGLPAAGKTTLARLLTLELEKRDRTVTLLDGDEVRRQISWGLGFSKDDRHIHALRVAYVAGEVIKHGGIAIVALVSPYTETRREARDRVGSERFVEVHVHAPIALCAKRDPKGLYKRAREGRMDNLTGIGDPYECPRTPEIFVGTENVEPSWCAEQIMNGLSYQGYL